MAKAVKAGRYAARRRGGTLRTGALTTMIEAYRSLYDELVTSDGTQVGVGNIPPEMLDNTPRTEN